VTLTNLVPFLPLLAFLLFAARRLMSYLHIFQQEEYDGKRFLQWLARTRSVDRKLSVAIALLGLIELATSHFNLWLALITAGALVIFFLREADPRTTAKKKLILTPRAKRILSVAFFIAIMTALPLSLFHSPLLGWLIPIHLLPLDLVVANFLLMPFEGQIQNKFWQEAHGKLLKLKPTIIGITGSFGKTSVKHILGHVLEMHAPTLLTPGSVNTPMGIARTVREQLASRHRFFICEMGAYAPGSIDRLCQLAPPNIAVITAVGYAHYERFKSLDVVAKTKFELARAIVANEGTAIINEQVLDFRAAQDFIAQHRTRVTIVGASSAADLQVLAVRGTATGIEADLAWKGRQYTIKAPLYGEHHGINLALAFATAAVMGVPVENIILSLSTTPQIKHRLEVKRERNGSIIIDDAYNSNPIGFANGLRALDVLRNANGRRILVTPGMAELGAVHEEEHRKVGILAGSHVDVLLPVVPERIGSLITAYKTANPSGIVIPCESFAIAHTWLSANLQQGDTVLLENDLPDLYEAKLSL
jgi:UDP-N-acetylmuramoyl-tripeptide--D-alanyl-D-alanine ligase